MTTYVKVLDDLGDHPKWEDLDVEHVGLWVLALGYCSRNLTDGMVSARRLTKLGGTTEVVSELVAAGRLHEPGHGCADCPAVPDGKLFVHAYLEHQRSREQVEALSAKRAEAGRLGGAARSANQVAKQNSDRAKQADSKSKPDTDTDTDTDKDSPARARAAAVAADFETFWSAYPRKIGKQNAVKAYTKARKTTDAEPILTGLAATVADWRAHDTAPEFIPHPATWLNAGRWADELVPVPVSGPAVTLRQCDDVTPHPRHLWADSRNRYGCQGVEA